MCNICCLLLATTQINELSKTSVNSGFPQVQGVIIVFSKEFCSPNVCWVDLKLEGTYLFCYELFSVEHNAEIHQYSSEFWDLVNIRYGWPLSRTSKTCTCGNNFNIEHALTCKKSRVHYTLSQQTKKHNRQPTKRSVLRCSHRTTLQKLTGEQFEQRAANTSDEARLDVAARGFWAVGEIAFFDIRLFYSSATRDASSNENEKKRKYNNRVMNVEQGCFTTLVFQRTVVWVLSARNSTQY